MRVFVAGATGAVGRRLVPLLLAEGHEVTAIGRSSEKRAALADAFQVRDAVRLIRKGWAPWPGSPAVHFSSIHPDDAATAVVAVLRARAGAYEVADDEPLRRREYVAVLAAAIGAPPPRLPPGVARGRPAIARGLKCSALPGASRASHRSPGARCPAPRP